MVYLTLSLTNNRHRFLADYKLGSGVILLAVDDEHVISFWQPRCQRDLPVIMQFSLLN